ncbi:MAG: hypothetical protein IK134_05390 [Oscillospiraceae bacterium]|nr:hypothetical protein [Oscillospiraceae bacterium]
MFDNLNIYEWLFDMPGRRNIRKADKRKKAKQAEIEKLKNKYKHSPFFRELLNFINRKDRSYIVWSIHFRGGAMKVQWVKIDSKGYCEQTDCTRYPDLLDTLVLAEIGYDSPESTEHYDALYLAFQEVLGDKYKCELDEYGGFYDRVTLKDLPPTKPSGLKPTL